ncbi:hypothetical protein EDB19DRAFT_1645605 [Suillus lakei]|nr:hypothetical protein EDB19DRAFT_1645605 [Suillus lakei]
MARSSNAVSSIPSITRSYWTNRGRGGKNLTERYRKLENTLRRGNAVMKQISELSQEVEDGSNLRHGAPNTPDTTAGFVVPEEPIPPSDEECCMSGCAICVYDLYEESLQAYKESIVALRLSLSALSIPESEWPDRVKTNTPATAKRQEVILSAFEEMERQMKEKKERRAAVEAES